MYSITKEFFFEASHQLMGLPDKHPCGRCHGHSYRIEVVLENDQLNEHGFVVDFNELKVFNEYVSSRCDHQHLNDVFTFQPTAENLARHFYEWIAGTQSWPLVAVSVSETGKTWASYSRKLAIF